MLALLVGALATAGLLAISCIASGDAEVLRRFVEGASPRASLPAVQAKGAYAVAWVAILAGIPAALGAFPAGLIVVVGAVIACTVSRRVIGDSAGNRDVAWVVPLSWAIVALVSRYQTFNIQAAMGAQSFVGASLMQGPVILWVSSVFAVVAGFAAGGFWVRSQVDLGNSDAARLLVAGERALVATIISASAWGPGVLGIVDGPGDIGGNLATLGSLAFVSLSVLVLGLLDRRRSWVSEKPALVAASSLAMAAVVLVLVSA